MIKLITALLSAIQAFLGLRKNQFDAKNSKDMVSNAKARDEAKRQDDVEETINKATQGDEKSLQDLRRLAGD
jgi:hypothetical protein